MVKSTPEPPSNIDDELEIASPPPKTSPTSDEKSSDITPNDVEELFAVDFFLPEIKSPISANNLAAPLVSFLIAASPTVLMAAYPVRGLDINSSYTIYNLLNEQKKKGVAVIFVGEDLDVLIELCDRIMVIGSGRITGIVDGRTATKEEIGLLMTKSSGGENNG